MSSVTIIAPEKAMPVVEYAVADQVVSELRGRLEGLTADTPAGYREVVAGISEARKLRVDVEKDRVELKAASLEHGRKVDAEAKRITKLIEAIEQPLKLSRKVVDDEKARVKREKEEAEQAKLEEINRKKREEQEAIDKADRDRIQAEQQAEQKRIDVERAELEKQRAAEREKQKADQAKLEAEKEVLRKEREELRRQRFEQEAKVKAEREAKEEVEREAREEIERKEVEEAERKRAEAMKPDIVLVGVFAQVLRDIGIPVVVDGPAQGVVIRASNRLIEIASDLEQWCLECQALGRLGRPRDTGPQGLGNE